MEFTIIVGVWLHLVTEALFAIYQCRSKEEEDKERQENYQSGEEGDERSSKDGPQGPWKAFQSPAAAPVARPVTPPVKETGECDFMHSEI